MKSAHGLPLQNTRGDPRRVHGACLILLPSPCPSSRQKRGIQFYGMAGFFFFFDDRRTLAVSRVGRGRETTRIEWRGKEERERESQKGKENNIIDREERVRDTETQRYKVDARTKRLLLSVMRDPPPWKPSQPHAVS